MKRLTLLRHAKSSWDDPVARDFDRRLNARGHRGAQAMGREMRSLGLSFQQVIASPAQRVVETLDDVEATFGPLPEPAYDKNLYLASAPQMLDIINDVYDGIGSLLIVGHNPGMEDLALRLGADGALWQQIEIKYPTGALVEIEFAADYWREVDEGEGTITRFVRPRDLDPELGPEEEEY